MIHIDQPLNWANVSIDEYLQLQDLLTEDGAGESQEDLVMQELQILYGVNPYKMEIGAFRNHVKSLEFMTKPIPKMKVRDTYTLNGARYWLRKSLADFKVAQFIDYSEIYRGSRGADAYPEFIALFLIPSSDGDYGDGYDVQAVASDIRRYMSIADAMSIATFFLDLSRAYTVRSLWCSYRRARKAVKDRTRKRELRRKTRKAIRLILHGGA